MAQNSFPKWIFQSSKSISRTPKWSLLSRTLRLRPWYGVLSSPTRWVPDGPQAVYYFGNVSPGKEKENHPLLDFLPLKKIFFTLFSCKKLLNPLINQSTLGGRNPHKGIRGVLKLKWRHASSAWFIYHMGSTVGLEKCLVNICFMIWA